MDNQHLDSSKTSNNENKKIEYIDIEEIEYSRNILHFLRKKLDDFTINCLRKVTSHHKKGGLHKTKIKDYEKYRKKYDAALLTLEAQGFIEKRNNGIYKPYFLTIRGFQLIHLLQEEKQLSER